MYWYIEEEGCNACHYLGPLALRSEALIGYFMQVLSQLGSQVDDDQWSLLINSIWAIWRCRNDATYGGIIPGLQQFKDYFFTIQWESVMGAVSINKQSEILANNHLPQVCLTDFSCYLDGSWIQNWHEGIGFAIFHKEELVLYKSSKAIGNSPLAVEALALRAALDEIRGLGITECTFFSDCQTLVDVVSHKNPPADVDWRAFTIILKLWEDFRVNEGIQCAHVKRELNDLSDRLAN